MDLAQSRAPLSPGELSEDTRRLASVGISVKSGPSGPRKSLAVSAGFSPRGRSVQQIEPFRNLPGLTLSVIIGRTRLKSWLASGWNRSRTIALIERDRKELTTRLVHEQGKPVTEAGGEIHHLIHGLNYYADLATKVRGSYQRCRAR